jgi:hypothetical protein
MMPHHSITRQGKPVPNYVRHPGSIWIDDNRSTLPNNEWVASNGSKMVAHASSIDELLGALHSKNVNVDEVAIAYITTDAV